MYADLENDFVFRRIFGRHPELTAALLNDLLDRQGEDRIVSLTLVPPEHIWDADDGELALGGGVDAGGSGFRPASARGRQHG